MVPPVSTHAGSCLCQTVCILVLQEVAVGLAVLGAALPAESNHDSLLGAYVTLCSDRVWAVRKACADILPEIAKLAEAETRQTQLLPVFDKFCEDVSHWVQTSALQQLGPFMSTLEAHHIPQSESYLWFMAYVCSKCMATSAWPTWVPCASEPKVVSECNLLVRVLECDRLTDITALLCQKGSVIDLKAVDGIDLTLAAIRCHTKLHVWQACCSVS